MSHLRRAFARPRSSVAFLALLIALMAPVQLGTIVSRSQSAEPLVATAPGIGLHEEPVPSATPTPSAPPTPPAASPTRSPTPSPRVAASPTRPATTLPPPGLSTFGGLGAWVDVYDYPFLDPVEAIAEMKRHGVRTVYLQTGRFNTDHDVDPAVGPWLVAANAVGIRTVGWYLPSYARMNHEVRRTLAIARYRYQGHRFDALGVDIEYRRDVANPEWNRRVVRHLERVRAELGRGYLVASIVPPPLQMEVAPAYWRGFPWRDIARTSDVIMLMSYWSYRDCPNVEDHCAYPFTVKNIRETRRLTGDARIPIHTIGGVGDRITRAELRDFVRGALDARAFGGSLYDHRTTSEDFWPILRRLAVL